MPSPVGFGTSGVLSVKFNWRLLALSVPPVGVGAFGVVKAGPGLIERVLVCLVAEVLFGFAAIVKLARQTAVMPNTTPNKCRRVTKPDLGSNFRFMGQFEISNPIEDCPSNGWVSVSVLV